MKEEEFFSFPVDTPSVRRATQSRRKQGSKNRLSTHTAMPKDWEAEDRQMANAVWQEVIRDVTPLHPSKQKPLEQEEKLSPMQAASAKAMQPMPVVRHAAAHYPLEKMDPNSLRLIKLGRMPIAARLDLHDMGLIAAHDALSHFLRECWQSDRRLVLVITGKGGVEKQGLIRRSLPRWCAEPELARMVAGLHKAWPKHGGDGAFYLRLRRHLP